MYFLAKALLSFAGAIWTYSNVSTSDALYGWTAYKWMAIAKVVANCDGVIMNIMASVEWFATWDGVFIVVKVKHSVADWVRDPRFEKYIAMQSLWGCHWENGKGMPSRVWRNRSHMNVRGIALQSTTFTRLLFSVTLASRDISIMPNCCVKNALLAFDWPGAL